MTLSNTTSDRPTTPRYHVRRAVAVAALTLLACLVAMPSAAYTIYVNNQVGNDRFDGRSPQPTGRNMGPVETIARGVKMAGSGGRVVIAATGQSYYENIALFGFRNSGTPRQPFRIEGQGAVIDGTIPVPPRAWEIVGGTLFRFKPERLAPQVLYHKGKPLEQVTAKAESIVRPPIKTLQWCYYEGYIYFRVESHMVPEMYALRHAGHGAGIMLYRVDGVEISGLTIQGFQFDGIQAKDVVSQIRLVGLNLRGNGRSGLSVTGASQVAVSKCLIGNNGQAQVRVEGYCQTLLDDCDVLDNTAPSYFVGGGKLFIDGKPYDRRPPADSP